MCKPLERTKKEIRHLLVILTGKKIYSRKALEVNLT
jgi:hypothetical protein